MMSDRLTPITATYGRTAFDALVDDRGNLFHSDGTPVQVEVRWGKSGATRVFGAEVVTGTTQVRTSGFIGKVYWAVSRILTPDASAQALVAEQARIDGIRAERQRKADRLADQSARFFPVGTKVWRTDGWWWLDGEVISIEPDGRLRILWQRTNDRPVRTRCTPFAPYLRRGTRPA